MRRPSLQSAPQFIGLVIVCLLLQSWETGKWLMYPFALFGTWAHELGHGLSAMLMGYEFVRLELFSNLGGTAYYLTDGGRLKGAFISAFGLLGPSVLGAFVILSVRRWHNPTWVLVFLAALAGLTALWWSGNWFTTVVGAVFAVAMVGLIKLPWVRVRDVIVQFLGIQLFISAFTNVDYMFTKQFERGGQVMLSDTGQIAEALLLPYWFWGGVITLITVGILWLTLRGSKLS